MIPDFKTYLKEATWNDIRKQSAGSQVRREEDIDLMDIPAFKEYLETHYVGESKHFVEPNEDPKGIYVFFARPKDNSPRFVLFLDVEKSIVTFGTALPKECPGIYRKLHDVYEISLEDIEGEGRMYVIEPDRVATNTFFLEVLDFAIDSGAEEVIIKRKVSESVWNDIRKQSAGTKERLEDNLDSLDPVAFYKYLVDTYKCDQFNIANNTRNNTISVPILQRFKNVGSNISYNYREYYIHMNANINEYAHELIHKMNDVYDLKVVAETAIYKKLIIGKKDGSEVTNQFFVDVIEFILKNADERNIILYRK